MARRRSRSRIWVWVVLVFGIAVFVWYRFPASELEEVPQESLVPVADSGEPARGQLIDPNEVPVVESVIPTDTQPASPPAGGHDEILADAEIQAGLAAKDRGELLVARNHLSRALQAGLSGQTAKLVRQALTELAQQTIFSRVRIKDDPLTDDYVIRYNDNLAKIAKQYKVSEDLLAEVNGIINKNLIRAEQGIKVVQGPFHAKIDKSDHLIHVYLQDVYVRTFRVALGTGGSTPVGRWKVKNHLTNPSWTDPRPPYKRWHPDDPDNPIGEFWIGLEGIEGQAVNRFGYGIHGTIEPETIGQDVSLGCVRLATEDIVAVYKLLVPGESLVTIVE